MGRAINPSEGQRQEWMNIARKIYKEAKRGGTKNFVWKSRKFLPEKKVK